MIRVRVLPGGEEEAKAEAGRELDLDAASARSLIERGLAERIILRSNTDIERS